MTLVDTNILLDLATRDPVWLEWSRLALEAAGRRGPVCINAAVYAEFSVGFVHADRVDELLAQVGVELIDIPRRALFLAGKAFARYRARGGTRTGVLPDFFIGAHATVLNAPLLTRDRRRYQRYYPSVTLLAP